MKKALPTLVLTLLLLGLFIGGQWVVEKHLQQAKALINDQVNSIARLKVQQIAAMRWQERLADAELLRVNPTIVTDVLGWLAGDAFPRERSAATAYLEASRAGTTVVKGFLLIDAEREVRYSSARSRGTHARR
jgi:hypothetical protein